MQQIKLLFLIILLSACNFRYTTDSNIDVVCEHPSYCYSIQEVELIIDTFISLTKKPSETAKYFSEDNLVIKIKTEERIGLFDDRDGNYNITTNKITVGYYDCPSYSAIGHELIHAYYSKLFNITDHSNVIFFVESCETDECYDNAMETKIYDLTKQELCGF